MTKQGVQASSHILPPPPKEEWIERSLYGFKGLKNAMLTLEAHVLKLDIEAISMVPGQG